MKLKVNEIFRSILGESTFTGLPAAFVRLTSCNLRCSYCDTRLAYENGIEMTCDQIIRAVGKYRIGPVLITGGEPLAQDGVFDLMNGLLDLGHIVLLETNGSVAIKNVPEEVITIMDIKCPGSGMEGKMMFDNIDYLSEPDNIKFVLCDRRDYDWALDVMDEYELTAVCPVLMSPAHELMDPRELSEWMIKDSLPARLSLQIHKILWDNDTRGR